MSSGVLVFCALWVAASIGWSVTLHLWRRDRRRWLASVHRYKRTTQQWVDLASKSAAAAALQQNELIRRIEQDRLEQRERTP